MSYSDYFNFEIVKSSAQSNARAGLFSTPHGLIETPIFI
jgi:queuine/archaeosine tRNA-ribosyltransferase